MLYRSSITRLTFSMEDTKKPGPNHVHHDACRKSLACYDPASSSPTFGTWNPPTPPGIDTRLPGRYHIHHDGCGADKRCYFETEPVPSFVPWNELDMRWSCDRCYSSFKRIDNFRRHYLTCNIGKQDYRRLTSNDLKTITIFPFDEKLNKQR